MRTMIQLMSLLVLSSTAACVTDGEGGDNIDDMQVSDGKSDSPTSAGRRLVASTNPNEIRLARVETVLGTGLRTIVTWERATELNGRDLWLTLRPREGEAMAWRTPEDIVSVDALQFSSGTTRVIGKENRTISEGFIPVVGFSLAVALEQDNAGVAPTIHLHKDAGAAQRDYDLQPTEDALATYLAQIDQVDRVESADYLVRLVMLDPTLGSRAASAKKLVLVLTDHETNKVFPLGFDVSSASSLEFSSPREVTFVTSERQGGSDVTKHYAISWGQTGAPTIRLVP